jgi:hypothetical protein
MQIYADCKQKNQWIQVENNNRNLRSSSFKIKYNAKFVDKLQDSTEEITNGNTLQNH